MSKLMTACAMALFIATRTVQAKPMNRQEYNDLRGWEVPDNENPADDGYLVVNSGVTERNVEGFDGYVSWLPKLAFEEQYKNDNLTYGQAVEFLKQGKKVARKGWNGKDMFLFYVPANKYPADGNKLGTLKGIYQDDLVPYKAYIAMKTVDGEVVPWRDSQTDVLAEDWVIVE